MGKTVERVVFDATPQFKRKRTAAYARASVGTDAMKHSLAAQVSYYSKLIQKNPEWEYCGVYADEALTGTKDDRRNFQRLLADCRAGRIDVVITKSISRFARNTVTLLETVRELKDLGIDIYFEEQNIRTLSSEGELLLTLLASFAQAESLSVSENIKWRIRKDFENGELMGLRFMLGYNIKKGEITVNEEEAEIIREIFARAVRGDSLESISRWLKENNVVGVRGGTITATRARDILESKKYTGNALLQKTSTNNHLEKKRVPNRGELPMYYAEGTHEDIDDMETFEKAQARLKEIRESFSGRNAPKRTAFTGVIRCAKCGDTFARAYNHKAVWQCHTYRHKGRDVCDGKQVPEEILKRRCCEALGTEEFDEDVFQARVTSIQADNDSESNILTFILSDGRTTVKRWQNPSRSESWTPEMKAKAREAGKRKGGRKNA